MKFEKVVEEIIGLSMFSKSHTLENTKKFLEELNHPEKNLKIIHVAGTNGKGSVCAYLNSIYIQSGKKAGMFTSPHLVDIRERIQINGKLVSKEEFTAAYKEVKEAAIQLEKKGYHFPNFFEFIFGLAMKIFSKSDVEYVILETGLGGRKDATNAVESPLVSIITSVSLDHTEILGDTIQKIAVEKAGIIKSGIPVIFDDNSPEVFNVINEEAKNKSADSFPISKENLNISKISNKGIDFSIKYGYDIVGFSIPFFAKYQVINAAIALKAIEVISAENREEMLDIEVVQRGLKNVQWPGRMERIAKNVFVDGAHNEAGVSAFIEAALEISMKQPVTVLFSAMKDKYYMKMLERLSRELHPDNIIITQVDNARAATSEELFNMAKEINKDSNINIFEEKSLEQAYKNTLEKRTEKGFVFVVGSLYMIGDLKRKLGGYLDD